MCPPSYHHNGFVANHALGHMIYGYPHVLYSYTDISVCLSLSLCLSVSLCLCVSVSLCLCVSVSLCLSLSLSLTLLFTIQKGCSTTPPSCHCHQRNAEA